MTTQRDFPSCGLIQNPDNGPEVVVAGYGTSEIFSLTTLSWRDGPELAYFYWAQVAQLYDTFLIVGGWDDSRELGTIYEFDHINYGWILRGQHLQLPRDSPGVVALPEDAITCS